MVAAVNSLEGGTSGTAVTTANSGGASGNAFDLVVIGASATCAFDSAHAAHGSLGLQVATPAGGAAANIEWNTSVGTLTQTWFRLYAYVTAAPSVNHRLYQTTGASSVGAVTFNTAGKLVFQNTTGATVLTSLVVPLNAWWRLEGFTIGDAAVGQWEYKIWYSPDSAGTPDDTQTSAATQSMFGASTKYRFGCSSSVVNVGPLWLDDFGVSSVGYLGPAVTPLATQPLVVPQAAVMQAANW